MTLDRRSDGPRVGIRSADLRYDPNRFLARLRRPRGRPCPVVNLSRQGAQFLSAEALRPTATLRVTLDVPAFLDPIAVDAKVVWCRPIEKRSVYRIGIRLLSEAPEAVLRLLRDDTLRHRERSAFLR